MSRRLIENTNQLTDLSKEKLVLGAKVLVQPPQPESSGAKRKRSADGEVRERVLL